MADGVTYVYRGESYSRGSCAVMTIYEVRNNHDVFIWDGYRPQNSSIITCYPRRATMWGARDGIKRDKFKISDNEIVVRRETV